MSGGWQLKRRKGRKGWHAYRFRDGRTEWVSLGAENEQLARQALAELETRTSQAQVRENVSTMLEAYLKDREGKVHAFKRLREAVRPLALHLGHLRPDQINQRQWSSYTEKRGVSHGTLRRERNVLIAALNLAHQNGAIMVVPTIKPPPSPPPRDRYLTKEEAKRLLDSFESFHARLLYSICLYTGCRKGAALSLTWDRVDFTANRIDFRLPSVAEHSKRRAIVPMGPKLRSMMEEAYQVRTIDAVIEWAGQPATRVRWPFQRARDRAGLGPDVTPHVLRHTAASWLAMKGIPIDQASDLLACDPNTLRRVYRKFDPSYLRDAVLALED